MSKNKKRTREGWTSMEYVLCFRNLCIVILISFSPQHLRIRIFTYFTDEETNNQKVEGTF